ncbi:hypothetical protein KDH_70040 [Dictyobacter sp. S3.2.2.5]|uniref:Uncharacterized protein n=1 Tax=Dictyobacter halimunensis TaxID=3026934 RepID=A0ABQ6G3T0_9CHLR|nr:hypothetical protein KDH_70040 [Dictyobacter sp. S3.2.2.5]
MPWCRFFIPKIASPGVKPGDPDLNEHISYAKCIKGHVLRDASEWVQCENLPAADAKCWQEGGDTLFTLSVRRRNEEREATSNGRIQQEPKTHASKS